jgi:D-amino peptidase
MTDMEGVSGVVDFDDSCFRTSPYYETARRLTTQEVNAAIEGILSTGRHDIVVCDGHGEGAIDIERLHKEAALIVGNRLNLSFELDDGRFDGLLMIGQHAMKGAPGANLDHTFDHRRIKSLSINGQPMGEAGVNALHAGVYDIPVLFLSGDTAACAEIETLIPGTITCSVKRGINSASAICLQPEKAREKIKERVAKAVSSLERLKPFQLQPPFEAVFEFLTPDALAPYVDRSYCKITDPLIVRIQADSLQELLEKRLWGLA